MTDIRVDESSVSGHPTGRRDIIAAGVMIPNAIGLPSRAAAQPSSNLPSSSLPSPEPVSVSLVVNRQSYALSLDPRTTLLDLLREHLDLTGTKKGCDQGQCYALPPAAESASVGEWF